jgi:uncharacterized protein (DUF4415 family)
MTRPTAKEEAIINQGIALDEDNPEWTENDFARARSAREVLPEIVGRENADLLLQRGPGRPPKENPKKRITIRLDADLVAWIKDQGPGYQTRINAILREAMER